MLIIVVSGKALYKDTWFAQAYLYAKLGAGSWKRTA